MAVRTKQLALFNSGTAPNKITVYTCPAGETAILKSMDVRCRVAGPCYLQFSVRSAAGADWDFFRQVGWVQHQSQHFEWWLVLMAGQKLMVASDVTSSFEGVLSGTELEGVAD